MNRFVTNSAGLILLFGVSIVRADTLSGVSLGFNQFYEQTSNSALSTPSYFFSAGSTTTSGGGSPGFTSESVSGPFPGSPQSMTAISGGFLYQTGFLTNLNSFPAGSYTITGTRSDSTTQSATIAYAGSQDYTSTTPLISNFSSLAGLNPAQAFTFDFSAFIPNALGSSAAFTFLTISNTTTGTTVFSDGFLPDTTSSVTVPGGTFAANTEYTFDLVYDDRIDGTNSGVSTFQLFDNRTDGNFTTGSSVSTPEPISAAMMGIGTLSLLLFARLRDRKWRMTL